MIQLALFPSKDAFIFKDFDRDPITSTLRISLQLSKSKCNCPVCDYPSYSVHSMYYRTIKDLPWSDYGVVFMLKVRKFYCHQPDCCRKIFTERFEEEIHPYARTTARFKNKLATLSLFFGAKPLSNLSSQMRIPCSNSTLLRATHQYQFDQIDIPVKVLGVDDWAICKHIAYGTILVDLETNKPIGLLKDRNASTFKKWLIQHPGVEIISRDRSGAYAAGGRSGAPEAIQIADRWHLLDNFSAVIHSILEQHHKLLQEVSNDLAQKEYEQLVEQAKKQRLEKPKSKYELIFEEVKKLEKTRLSKSKMARQLNISRGTVLRFTKREKFTKERKFPSKLFTYKAHILKLWKQGERSPKRIWESVCKKGYKGSLTSCSDFIKRHIKTHVDPPELKIKKRTAADVRNILLTHQDKMKLDNNTYMQALWEVFPEIKQIRLLYFQFRNILIHKQPDQLDDWLQTARQITFKQFHTFVKGVEDDYEAIKNAAIFKWSNGPVEGQVNKLKMIKRMGYGRDSIDLLEKKILIRNYY